MGNRILLDSGEFVSLGANREQAASIDPAELQQAKSDLATSDRKLAAANAQVERLQKEYDDIKKAYDANWAELKKIKEEKSEKPSGVNNNKRK